MGTPRPRQRLRTLLKTFEDGPGARSFLRRNITLDPARFLWTVIVDVTTGCNLRCPMCKRAGSRRAHADARAVEGLKKALPHAAEMALGCRHEPLLHPRLAGLIGALRDEKERRSLASQLYLLTSGTLLSPSRCTALMRSGVDSLLLSIDTTDEATYAVMRRPAKWPDLEKKLGTLVEAVGGQGEVAVQSLITRTSLPHLISSVERLSSLGVRSFTLTQMTVPPTTELESEVVRSAGEGSSAVRTMVRKIERLAAHSRLRVRLPGNAPAPVDGELFPVFAEGAVWDEDLLGTSRPTVCVAPWFKIRVDHEGFVYPCQFHVERDRAWGNLSDHSFEACVNSERARTMRAGMLTGSVTDPTCRACPLRPQRPGAPGGPR